ncbi:hypothetical protein EYF80_058183 [Liparis tanakae]|uniref:Uncharacterized protein n=1 Tax=Liparis tanakae TaxID=230148 RepID=A0A4Z2ES74_9TELE|nr:hypothetical protein EYF80_058183 [Liparis tanakae]
MSAPWRRSSSHGPVPPVLAVRVQNSTVTKPPDWRTFVWTRGAGDGTRDQSKSDHTSTPRANLHRATNGESHRTPGAEDGRRRTPRSSDALGVLE